ncbi:MAG TPA: ABC transporter ATP-binding protein [Halobacteriales archaeon]|nr:ABC transporter ATP-binding protein [Halobacteriales archaeon]
MASASSNSGDGKRSIRLENVKKSFDDGNVIACEDIDLEIGADEFVVLLGPSGCGKTTTLRTIAGLELPDEGRIYIGDIDVTEYKPKDRDLAFVFQTIALFPHMTARENIRFGLDMKTNLSEEKKRERVETAGEVLDISELLDRRPTALSGGQQQRVALGRAMVMEPAAFLLDEPFSALDANLRDQMQTEVKHLQRRLETGMVFVTHDQSEAMTLGDKIVVMDDGRIQQIGSPYQIYNEPENRFVAEFIGSPSTNFLDCEVETGDGTATLSTALFSKALTPTQREELAEANPEPSAMGIRPEYLELTADDGLLEVEVTLVEPKGSEDVVYMRSGDRELRATTEQGAVESGMTTAVDFDVENVWLFDGDGGRLL